MAAARPFDSEEDLFEKGSAIWNGLKIEDRLEAFAAHPKIGEQKAAPAQQARSAEWSVNEQSGVNGADEVLKNGLTAANQEYFDKFGFNFIVCASGKTGAEMLKLCRTRLANEQESELESAGAEQAKITQLRLEKLLSR